MNPGKLEWRVARRGLAALLLLAASAWGLSGCSVFYSKPQVRVLGVEVRNLGITSGSLDVHIEVNNPNRFAVELRGMRYRLELADPDAEDGWLVLASGEAQHEARVPRRGVEELALNLPFRYGALGSAVRVVLRGEDIAYRILGDVRARVPLTEMDFPFESRGLLEM